MNPRNIAIEGRNRSGDHKSTLRSLNKGLSVFIHRPAITFLPLDSACGVELYKPGIPSSVIAGNIAVIRTGKPGHRKTAVGCLNDRTQIIIIRTAETFRPL